jgi:hypothetical protein
MAVEGIGGGSAPVRTTYASGALPPFSLRLTTMPFSMLAQSGQPGRFVVSLWGNNGTPLVAPRDIEVNVTSSNSRALSPVQETYIIPAGRISVEGEYLVGAGSIDMVDVFLSAQAEGFSLASEPIRVFPAIVPPPAAKLAAFVAPLPFYPQEERTLLVVQGLDQDNTPTTLPCGSLRVAVDALGAVEMETPLHVPAGMECGRNAAFAVGYLKAGPNPAPANLSVTLPGLQAAEVEFPLFQPPASRLVLSFAFQNSVMSDRPSNFIVAQIQDAGGLSAPVSQPTELFLFSSEVLLPNAATLQPGESFKVFPVALNLERTTFTIDALVPGLDPASAQSIVSNPALKIDITTSSGSVAAGKSAEITAVVTLSDLPVQGASLSWNETSGTLLNASSVTDANGVGTATFIPDTGGSNQVFIQVNYVGLTANAAPAQVRTVAASSDTRSTPSLNLLGFKIPVTILLVLIAVLFLGYLGYRLFWPARQGKPPENPQGEGAYNRDSGPQQ